MLCLVRVMEAREGCLVWFDARVVIDSGGCHSTTVVRSSTGNDSAHCVGLTVPRIIHQAPTNIKQSLLSAFKCSLLEAHLAKVTAALRAAMRIMQLKTCICWLSFAHSPHHNCFHKLDTLNSWASAIIFL